MPDRVSMRGLVVEAGPRRILHEVDLELPAGKLVALVGTSGSGKSLLARSLVGLVRARPGVVAGDLCVEVDGTCIRPYAEKRQDAFASLRGRVLTYMPQDAVGALDPLWTVGHTMRAAGASDVVQCLDRVGLTRPAEVQGHYPHELSGGMAARVNVARALARGSRWLLADEPTTGLDPTAQAAILALLARLRDQGVGVLLITHDLRVVPGIADEVVVLHQGRVVDTLPASRLHEVQSLEAQALLRATARVAGAAL